MNEIPHEDFKHLINFPEDRVKEMEELAASFEEASDFIKHIRSLTGEADRYTEELEKTREDWQIKSSEINQDGTITVIYDTDTGLWEETLTSKGEKIGFTQVEEDIIPFWKEE